MINVKLDNPTIILTPLTEEEAKTDLGFAGLYVLYVNPLKEVEIGIPDMEKYNVTLANMHGFENATKKAYFFNGETFLKIRASEVTDRPVYEILPSDDRKVVACNIINDVNVGLTDVLNGKFKPEKSEINKLGL